MAYNPFVLPIYVAFDSLLQLEDSFAGTDEKTQRLLGTEKKVDETKILENKIEIACQLNDYSEDYYPIIFGFARGVTRVFYNTPMKSFEIIEDVINMRQESPVLAEMKKEQITFLKQSKEFLEYTKGRMLEMHLGTFYKTERRFRLASSIFTSWQPATMTDDEYGKLITLGDLADKVKQQPTPFLIMPYPKAS